ncbi:Metallo-peptidase family M12-domain-containing protein [Lasiosphaeria miniovina]|uniref:Disintegrin and metalloproteinase domain-containing protein B n=1 Tax=Lasiosphaeria miniovina TaxID=1954250 RepID=A0AA40DKG8_9PEZI|nr:Metallo-peptidase family M12-domain-containing protein [Lasiosphaeria miniovina]KAK0706520.1 Metallo-peptidase family M12-domain-containing protein [Lasiosphaeria miniovina]
MILPKAFAALFAGVGLLLQPTTAHSVQRNALSYVTRIDEAVIHSPSHRVTALSSFELTFRLHDGRQKIRLSLEPNHDIFGEGATIQRVGADGRIHSTEPINRLDHKIFKGSALIQHEGHSEWTNAGWARINVHRDGDKPIFEGAFRIDGDHHHVQTNTNYLQTIVFGDPHVDSSVSEGEYMVVWRDSDISVPDFDRDLKRDLDSRSSASCQSDGLEYNLDNANVLYRGMETRDLFGRQIDTTPGGNGAGVNLASTIGSTAGCPSTRKVALVGIAADCNYRSQFSSENATRTNIIQQVNSASQLYENTFNISLGIHNLTISEKDCPSQAAPSAPWNVGCSGSTSISDRLNLFSAWRGQSKDNNAYWTLLSTCNTGAAVGLAWLGQVCQEGAQTSANETIAAANVVVRTSTEWLVFAHETGHTFGAVHDCTVSACNDGLQTKQQCCPLSSSTCDAGSRFIMNPSTGSGITNFSPCSIGNICSFLGRSSGKINCLANNKDVTIITGSQCGNGIVESGEDCDCGGDSGCAGNPCCDANTCKFTTNSKCDPSNEDCCTSQCQFSSAGSVCRPSTGSCDPQEVCSGTTPTCPPDQNSPDGDSCGTSGAGLQCASGQCTSRDLQCKTLMGSLTTSNDTYSCTPPGTIEGCVLQCSSPQFGANQCYSMNQYFLDGTPCDSGGRCSNGNCQGASLGNQILNWFRDNKNIVIPVASVIGGLIIIALVSCCWSSCRRRSRRAQIPKPPSPAWSGQGYGYGRAPPPPQAMRGAAGTPVLQQQQHPGQRPQSYANMPSPLPYPGQGPQQPPRQNGPWEPLRTRSFRYA